MEQRTPGWGSGELLEGPERPKAGQLPHTEGDTREVRAGESPVPCAASPPVSGLPQVSLSASPPGMAGKTWWGCSSTLAVDFAQICHLYIHTNSVVLSLSILATTHPLLAVGAHRIRSHSSSRSLFLRLPPICLAFALAVNFSIDLLLGRGWGCVESAGAQWMHIDGTSIREHVTLSHLSRRLNVFLAFTLLAENSSTYFIRCHAK